MEDRKTFNIEILVAVGDICSRRGTNGESGTVIEADTENDFIEVRIGGKGSGFFWSGTAREFVEIWENSEIPF